MRKVKILPYLLSVFLLTPFFSSNMLALDGVSDVGTTKSYASVSDEIQDASGDWNLSQVYNTKRGIMIRYSGLSSEDPYQIIHCKKSSVFPQWVSMDSWFSDDSEEEPYGELSLSSNALCRFLDIDCKNGQAYQYKVVYQLSGGQVLASDEVTMYRLTRPSITKASATKYTVSVQWKRNSKASGYEIRYATKSDFSNAVCKTVSGNKNTELRLKKLTKGQKYWIQVRSYKSADGTRYYSAWSNAKARTTKK
jgi:hypothetical protein